jgi:hypothetical protein
MALTCSSLMKTCLRVEDSEAQAFRHLLRGRACRSVDVALNKRK